MRHFVAALLLTAVVAATAQIPCQYDIDCGTCACNTDTGFCDDSGGECLSCGDPIGASCTSDRNCCTGNCASGTCTSCNEDCAAQDVGECKVSSCVEPSGSCQTSNLPDGSACSVGGSCFNGNCITQGSDFCQFDADCVLPCTCVNNVCSNDQGDACADCGQAIGTTCTDGNQCCTGNCVLLDAGGETAAQVCSSCSVDCATTSVGECQTTDGSCVEPTGQCQISNVEDGTSCASGEGVCQSGNCVADSSCDGGCTRPVDYWTADENNPEAYPDGTADTELCGFTYSEWMAGDNADASVVRLYIATDLNGQSGACFTALVSQAFQELGAAFDISNCFDLTPNSNGGAKRDVSAHSRGKRLTTVEAIEALEDYNNGLTGPGPCSSCEDGCVYCSKRWFFRDIPDELEDEKLCGRKLRRWLAVPGGCDFDRSQSDDSVDDNSSNSKSHDRKERDVEFWWHRWPCRAHKQLLREFSAAKLNIAANGACTLPAVDDALEQAAVLTSGSNCKCRVNREQKKQVAETLNLFNNGDLGPPECPRRFKKSSGSGSSSSHGKH